MAALDRTQTVLPLLTHSPERTPHDDVGTPLRRHAPAAITVAMTAALTAGKVANAPTAMPAVTALSASAMP